MPLLFSVTVTSVLAAFFFFFWYRGFSLIFKPDEWVWKEKKQLLTVTSDFQALFMTEAKGCVIGFSLGWSYHIFKITL